MTDVCENLALYKRQILEMAARVAETAMNEGDGPLVADASQVPIIIAAAIRELIYQETDTDV